MKILKVFYFVIICFIIISCETPNDPNFIANSLDKNNLIKENDSPNAISLSVSVTTNRTADPGGKFIHKITLKNGTLPVANAKVYIDDPIKLWCTWVTTNSLGEANYTTNLSNSQKPGIYSLKFYYSSILQWSTVVIRPTNTTNLTNYKIDVITAYSPSVSTKVNSETVNGFGNTTSAIISESAIFGYNVIKDYLSNPGNLALVAVTTVSCTAGQTIPGAGQTACAVGVKMVLTGITKTAIKNLANKMVDKSSNLTSTQKTQLHALIETANVAFSIATFDPKTGFEAAQYVSLGWTVGSATAKIFNSTSKGVSLSGSVSGSDDIYQISVYKR